MILLDAYHAHGPPKDTVHLPSNIMDHCQYVVLKHLIHLVRGRPALLQKYASFVHKLKPRNSKPDSSTKEYKS